MDNHECESLARWGKRRVMVDSGRRNLARGQPMGIMCVAVPNLRLAEYILVERLNVVINVSTSPTMNTLLTLTKGREGCGQTNNQASPIMAQSLLRAGGKVDCLREQSGGQYEYTFRF